MSTDISDRMQESPRAVFLRYASEGSLAFQVVASTGEAVFYPRVAQPGSGATDLEWRTSSGHGTVYAVTTVRPRGGEPHNVSMIELDEGFRLMSTVVGVDPEDVAIGQRVKVAMQPLGEPAQPLPVFELMGGQ